MLLASSFSVRNRDQQSWSLPQAKLIPPTSKVHPSYKYLTAYMLSLGHDYFGS